MWRTTVAAFPDELPAICRDPDDDLVLAAAVAGSCQYLVTGDNDLLVLGAFRDVKIVKPREFLNLLEGRAA
ncbi:MAG: putative toxin-antitoxin system toxin component, PIN family [Verrucomicrobiota bacterium]|nr:putative toxin-antitoxin system toxin component, PIN family [Verrucomicrobiota bacterium]